MTNFLLSLTSENSQANTNEQNDKDKATNIQMPESNKAVSALFVLNNIE